MIHLQSQRSGRRYRAGWTRLLLLLVLLGAALAPAHAAPATQDDPAAQCAEGVRLFRGGQPEEAQPLLEAGFAGRAQASFASSADLMHCALDLGASRLRAAEPMAALEPLGIALELARDLEDIEVEFAALYGIGGAYHSRYRYAEGNAAYQESLDLARAAKRADWELIVLSALSGSAIVQQQFVTAQKYIDEALPLSRRLENVATTAKLLDDQGSVYQFQQDLDAALASFEEALKLYRQIENPQGIAQVLQKIGNVQQFRGEISAARQGRVRLVATDGNNDPLDSTWNLHAPPDLSERAASRGA